MLNRFHLCPTLLIWALTILMVGCGKKAENNSENVRVNPELIPNELQALIDKQEVACDPHLACPNYISKIAVIQGKGLKFCTGFLVDDWTVATSTSCLPNFLRGANLNCSKDVFLSFPRTANRPAEKVGCDQVVQVSQLEGSDPVLWRDDVSFLRLDRPVSYRRQARFSREGVANNREYSIWVVDQLDEMTALVRRHSCQALQNTYINPLVNSESSPNLIFGNCPYNMSNSGAPIVDVRGRVRGMISVSISQKLRDFLNSTGLLVNPLKPMVHATNFACAPTIFDSEVLDERECLKELKYNKVDELRSNMLSSRVLFSEMTKKLEESINLTSKYINYGIELISNAGVQEAKIYPKCFKPLSEWLESLNGTRNNYVYEVSFPTQSFRQVMDENGRIFGQVVEAPSKNYFMQFSLKNLRSSKRSVIFKWNKNENDTFPDISENCPSLF